MPSKANQNVGELISLNIKDINRIMRLGHEYQGILSYHPPIPTYTHKVATMIDQERVCFLRCNYTYHSFQIYPCKVYNEWKGYDEIVENQDIVIKKVPCNLGGYSYAFICPITGKACRKLYLSPRSGYFRSLGAIKHTYPSQLLTRHGRWARKYELQGSFMDKMLQGDVKYHYRGKTQTDKSKKHYNMIYCYSNAELNYKQKITQKWGRIATKYMIHNSYKQDRKKYIKYPVNRKRIRYDEKIIKN